MCDTAIQTIFRAVIIAKLTYAWRGFTKASDRQRIDALIRRAKRCGYYDSDLLPLFDELCDNADEQLFDNLRRNSQHTLHNLPPESLASQYYSLRSRAHNRQLPEHFNHLDDSNFIIRMLYKNMY